jgi:cation diffusion facilitator CzcD-associated flavoprotein CzcO
MPLEHHDVAVIGSGFAGLGTAIELRRSGRTDFVVLERADALGGTWHANHYPGCACDVPTPYYSFSFAPKPDWSRFYAPHDEIRGYLEECADRFGVRPHLRLRQEVTALEWLEDEQRWRVDVAGAPALTARVVVAAPGGLSRPSYPDLEGLADFAGPWFHSAEWDHSVDLAGARVAVVGTGASAIQFVPRVAKVAAHVDVFQRTPPWVLPKPDRPIPGWERALYRRVPAAQRAMRGLVWAMQEYQGLANTRFSLLARPLEAQGRRWIRRSIKDPELAARLTPDYRIGCKRILLANDWYPTLAQPHVDVVSDGIARVSASGIVTRDGAERPADVLVFGTGFAATDPIGDLPIRGRGGTGLSELWRDGMAAHRGTTIAGMPNFFLMPGPNTGTGHTSQVFMIEAQVRHVRAALDRMDERGAAVIEPRAEAQAAFNADLQRRMADTVWIRGG